jgi:hypothetical protein
MRIRIDNHQQEFLSPCWDLAIAGEMLPYFMSQDSYLFVYNAQQADKPLKLM